MVDRTASITAQELLEAVPDAFVVSNGAGEIVLVNEPAERLFGYRRSELLGQPVEILMPARYRAAHLALQDDYFRHAHRRSMSVGPELYGLRQDGTEFPVEINLSPLSTTAGTFVISAIRDISDRKREEAERASLIRERAQIAERNLIRERARLAETSQAASAAREMSRRMSYLAQHDVLTALPNRLLLNDRLGRAITLAHRYGRRLALLFVDVDHFKQINDSLGHAVGDQLLRSVAERLQSGVRGSDTVSRHGGDEFLILLTEIDDAASAAVSARKIIAAATKPYRVGQHDLEISVSIGISVYPDDGQDAETLIKHADSALYKVKGQGRDGYQFFKHDMNAPTVERQSLEGSLRNAVARQEFVLHYQPKMNLESGAIIGAEALVRWQHPDQGLVPPAQFVPIAEECGLIVPIGQWVLREACRQARAWQDAGLRPVPVSVNISAVELQAPGFLEGVRDILRETRLDPRYLELELTETVLMTDADVTISVLWALRALGIQLAVDDFGTGYSSLSYLRQFPIDALKVDRSFVHEIHPDPEGAPIITAVISMGKSLKHRVIAEGVETREQLAFLQAQHCSEGQGFYFSRPLLAEQYAELLGLGERPGWMPVQALLSDQPADVVA